jgi:hypothetical protein
MYKKGFFFVTLAVFTFPTLANAHQVAIYEIGGEQYEFIVGSLNEPIAVDDNTGVDLSISMPAHTAMPAMHHHGAGGTVTGLENSLQVELIAGNKKRMLDLIPTHGAPGSYYAKFYPTVATTRSYRIFGELNGTPIDLTFTCIEDGRKGVDEGVKTISDEVTQISRTGGFGCPADKTLLGFPEESASIREVAGSAGVAYGISAAGLLLGALALILGGLAYRRRS